jgi:uncharacterized membrane protein YeaQ/YmgE (transglycosylase-associated protein family)
LEKEILSTEYIVLIITGIVAGTFARVITLVVDYRQNPTYPNGQFINVVTGFIASALGAVAIPAILEKDFTAITFLALAVSHFRDIRKLEQESLSKLESTEYVKRGHAYIDGISKTYESRNYISLITSLVTVLMMKIAGIQNIPASILLGLAGGLICVYFLKYITKGKTVGDICTVKPGAIKVEGSELYVDGMYVTNALGLDRSRDMVQQQGLAVVIEPNKPIFRITLENYGQRQAMLFEAIRALGVKRYRFTRRNFAQGKIVICFVPIINNMDVFIEAVRNTPILENSRKIHRIMTPRSE